MVNFLQSAFEMYSNISILFLVIYVLGIMMYVLKTPFDILTSKLKHNTIKILKRNTKELIYFIFLGFVGLHILHDDPKDKLKGLVMMNTILYTSIPIAIYKLLIES